MASECDSTGVVTRVSDESCKVALKVKQTSYSLEFTKSQFYMFGYACQESLANVLETGMDVNLRYKISVNEPYIVHAWLGEKPLDCNLLRDLFNLNGIVMYIHNTELLVQCGNNNLVIVNKDVVFYKGEKLKDFLLKDGINISLDAVPLKVAHSTGANYEATCAWIGGLPRIVDRFKRFVIHGSNWEHVKTVAMSNVTGTVIAIANDIVAFADVKSATLTAKVVLLRRSLRQSVRDTGFSLRQSVRAIKHFVSVGDILRMNIRLIPMFLGKRQWIAEDAYKIGEDETLQTSCATFSVKTGHVSSSSDVEKSEASGNVGERSNSSVDAKEGCESAVDSRTRSNSTNVEEKLKNFCDTNIQKKVRTSGDSEQKSKSSRDSSQKSTFSSDSSQKSKYSSDSSQKSKSSSDSSQKSKSSRNSAHTSKSSSDSVHRSKSSVDSARKSKSSIDSARKSESSSNSAHKSKFSSDSTYRSKSPIDSERKSKFPSGSASKSVPSTNVTDIRPSCKRFREPSLMKQSKKTFIYTDILYEDPPLSGEIASFQKDKAVICYKEYTIAVKRKVVFIDGLPASKEAFDVLVSSGAKRVNFEAVSKISKNCSRSDENVTTHAATLVWIGEKPSLNSFLLRKEVFNLTAETDDIYRGTIITYYLPRVVIIQLKSGKVISAFREWEGEREGLFSNHGEITELFKKKENVEFKVRQNPIFPGAACAYDVKVIGEPVKVASVDSLENKPTEVSSFRISYKKISTPEEEEENTEKVVHFRKLTSNRSYLLNFPGDLEIDVKNGSATLTLHHALGDCHVSMDDRALYALNKSKPVNCVSIKNILGRKIRFDAESSDNITFVVERAWFDGSPRPSPETNIIADLRYNGTESFIETKFYRGVITRIPLHDSAIAEVNGIPVLIPVKSLLTEEDINKNFSSIDEYVREGDGIILGISLCTFKCQTFFKATNCWKIADIKSSENTDSRDSWLSIWGCGEYFIRGCIRRRDEQYYIDFVSSDGAEFMLSLDGKGRSMFFVDGYPADPNLIKDLDQYEVTLHAAHECPRNGIDITLGSALYVSVAWIGKEPSPFMILKDKIRVLPGVIQSGEKYEGIIEDFPLPLYAICRVGTVPVVVILSEINRDGTFTGCDNIKLKKGDRVILHPREEACEDATCILSHNVSVGRLYSGIDILRNISGFIAEIPNPVGKVFSKCGGFVFFQLYCVREMEERFEGTVGSLSWFEYLKRILVVGRKVMFSAARVTSTKDCNYEAFEVVLLN